MLMAPWRQRVTDFDLCTPARAKPRPASAASKATAPASSMANSMNSVPRHFDLAGSAGSPGCAAPGRGAWTHRVRGTRAGENVVEKKQQGAVAVDRHAARRARPELIVEDLER